MKTTDIIKNLNTVIQNLDAGSDLSSALLTARDHYETLIQKHKAHAKYFGIELTDDEAETVQDEYANSCCGSCSATIELAIKNVVDKRNKVVIELDGEGAYWEVENDNTSYTGKIKWTSIREIDDTIVIEWDEPTPDNSETLDLLETEIEKAYYKELKCIR